MPSLLAIFFHGLTEIHSSLQASACNRTPWTPLRRQRDGTSMPPILHCAAHRYLLQNTSQVARLLRCALVAQPVPDNPHPPPDLSDIQHPSDSIFQACKAHPYSRLALRNQSTQERVHNLAAHPFHATNVFPVAYKRESIHPHSRVHRHPWPDSQNSL